MKQKSTRTHTLLLEWMHECADPVGQQKPTDAESWLSDFLRTQGETEALKLITKNGGNRNFALLKITSDPEKLNLQLQQEAHRALIHIARSIPRKHGWFHPDGDEEWESVADEVLVKRLLRYKKLGLAETLQLMLKEEFSHIYYAFRYGFLDEIRRNKRKWEDAQTYDHDFKRQLAPEVCADEELLRRDVIRGLKEPPRELRNDPGIRAVLNHAGEMLEEPGALRTTESAIRANLVKHISASRGVSQQQARKDVRRVLEYKNTLDPILQELRASAHCADAAQQSLERNFPETPASSIAWERGDGTQAA